MAPMDREDKEQPVIQLKNVELWRDRPLLKGIDWTVDRGQHWVVIGRNGAGKTLLLRIIAGYLWPSSGEVWVLNRRYGKVDLRELRRHMGWVSSALKEKIPAHDTALQVVLSGAYATFGLFRTPTEDEKRRAEALMEDMSLNALKDREYENLSSGEKQRVLLARACLPEPALLILDEPCAGLDLASREKFLYLVERMAKLQNGPTIIMVTHRVSEIMPSFRNGILIQQGRKVASGPIETILNDELLSKVFEVPVRVSKQKDRWQVQINT